MVTDAPAEALARLRARLRAIEADIDLPSNFAGLLDHAVDRDGKTATIDFFDQGVTLTASEFRHEVYRVGDGLTRCSVSGPAASSGS